MVKSSTHRSTTLNQGLTEVLDRYPISSNQTFKKHDLGTFVRRSLPAIVRSVVDSRLLVKGSVGNGNWAETPWVAVFDPTITKSAQKGFYVVYLFDSHGRHVYLSLNQATTEVKKEFKSLYEKVLAGRAEFARELLAPFGIGDLVQSQLDLVGTGGFTRGYRAGNIVSIRYDIGSVPDEPVLVRDLIRMINLYATYAAAKKGDTGTDEEPPDTITSREEARKYRWHRRAERNHRLAADAKRIHGTTCMVCSFNFETKYGERGRGYIEAHHIVPFAELVREPEPVTLNPKTDFVVVCANCHRMLHRTRPGILPTELRQLLI